MNLSEHIIRILCKHGVDFSVNYKAHEDKDFGSFINNISIKKENLEVVIRPEIDDRGFHLEGYILECRHKDNIEVRNIKRYESLCANLVELNVLPDTAWF